MTTQLSDHRGEQSQDLPSAIGNCETAQTSDVESSAMPIEDALRSTEIIDANEAAEAGTETGPGTAIVMHQRLEKLEDLNQRLQEVVEEAQLANQCKNEFLANVSHELRTPLNGIIGLTELVLDTELAPLQKEYLHAVKSSSEGLLQIISDLLDFSRMESGQFNLVPAQFDLREQFVATLKTLAVRAHQKGLEFVFDISPEVPRFIVGDARRILQVVSNLVGNAIKFTETGEVDVKLSVVRSESGKATLGFSVRDTGIGIAPEQQATIFAAFAQADGSTTREHGGTGLGLALSGQLVDMMGGRISLESRLGKGSTFTFQAPFPIPEQKLESTTQVGESLVGLDVLVVDNNDSNRQLVERNLRAIGLNPTVVADGATGLKFLEDGLPVAGEDSTKPWPIAFIDDRMPGVHGFVIAETIKKHPELVGTPIMMISPGDRRSLRNRQLQTVNRKMAIAAIEHQSSEQNRKLSSLERCQKLGFQFILKPFDQTDLLEVLAKIEAERSSQEKKNSDNDQSRELDKKTFRVLLAEDNRINQTLALNLLRREGYDVMIADNGRDALEAVQAEVFDLVLMDIQMPEMDGREATKAIRDLDDEQRSQVPIIALTAHDMEGDRDDCLAAGMNGYVTKPIKPKALFAEMNRFLRVEDEVSDSDSRDADNNPVECSIIDRRAVLGRVEGNMELLRQLVSTFASTHGAYMQQIRKAIKTQNCEMLHTTAHGLKGAVATLGGIESRKNAYELEQNARDNNLNQADELANKLEASLERLKEKLFEMTNSE